jgi:hypothetical protein
MIDRMNDEFHISGARKVFKGQEFGLGKRRVVRSPLEFFTIDCHSSGSFADFNTLCRLVILLGRVVSAPHVMCLHVDILLVYWLLGLDIASMIRTYRTNRCCLTMIPS